MITADLDIVFISYDEPEADALFEHLVRLCPRALRVHRVKGFDNAHKAAARLARSDRFVTVDGDSKLRESFLGLSLPAGNPPDYVYSYNAYNTVNGLVYGNGSVKIWPRDLVLKLNTHENGSGNDFCWTYRYWQVDHTASDAHFAQSAYHAFRAGFREAVKLSLVGGRKLASWEETRAAMYPPNFSRLMVWSTIGEDVPLGAWAIYGARCGLEYLWIDGGDPDLINDYDQFGDTWMRYRKSPSTGSVITGQKLERYLKTPFPYLEPENSRWFKTAYINYPRPDGPMLPGQRAPDIR